MRSPFFLPTPDTVHKAARSPSLMARTTLSLPKADMRLSASRGPTPLAPRRRWNTARLSSVSKPNSDQPSSRTIGTV